MRVEWTKTKAVLPPDNADVLIRINDGLRDETLFAKVVRDKDNVPFWFESGSGKIVPNVIEEWAKLPSFPANLMKWTRVTDALPEPQRHVVAFCPGYQKYYRWKFAEISMKDGKTWVNAGDHEPIAEGATHWHPLMPKPEPLPPRTALELAERMHDLGEMANMASMDRDDAAEESYLREMVEISEQLKGIPSNVMTQVGEMKELLSVHAPELGYGEEEAPEEASEEETDKGVG